MCVCVYTHMADGEGEDAKCFNNGVLQIFGKCDKCIEKMCNNNSWHSQQLIMLNQCYTSPVK